MNGVVGLERPKRKRFGTKKSQTSGSSLTPVSGLESQVSSTRHKVVDSRSSVGVLCSTIASIVFLQILTIRSQLPPKCGASSGLNFHFVCFWAEDCAISDWFHAAIHYRGFRGCTHTFNRHGFRLHSSRNDSRNGSKTWIHFQTGYNVQLLLSNM